MLTPCAAEGAQEKRSAPEHRATERTFRASVRLLVAAEGVTHHHGKLSEEDRVHTYDLERPLGALERPLGALDWPLEQSVASEGTWDSVAVSLGCIPGDTSLQIP